MITQEMIDVALNVWFREHDNDSYENVMRAAITAALAVSGYGEASSPYNLETDITTLYEITCDQANEITRIRALLRRLVDLDGDRDGVAALISETRCDIDD